MKRVLFGLIALAAFFTSGRQATAADVVFHVKDSSDLTGTVTINTATGTVASANLEMYYGGSEVAYFDETPQIYHFDGYVEIEVEGVWLAEEEPQFAYIVLRLSTKSLVGYTGGAFFGQVIVENRTIAGSAEGHLEP
jgi:hypothetical protein